MSNLVKDISSIELETLDNIKSSKSANTIRAYKSDFNDFVNFCKKNNFKPLPADPKIVSFYITHLSLNSKVSTLKRRLASISVIHKLKGHYIDIKHPLIIENLMGIQRKKGVFQKSKNPILVNELRQIINIIEKNSTNEPLYDVCGVPAHGSHHLSVAALADLAVGEHCEPLKRQLSRRVARTC